MPVFNKAEFIEFSVLSVLRQDFFDFELIIIDDGSTDESYSIIENIKDSRIKLFHQVNSGVSVARNNAVGFSKGQFICFLDADDYWAENHLFDVYRIIEQYPSAIAWTTGYSDVYNSYGALPNVNLGNSSFEIAKIDELEFYRRWLKSPFFWTGSIAVLREVLVDMQPCFPIGENLGEDQDLWFRLVEKGYIIYNNIRHTAFYRRGVFGSLTNRNTFDSPLPVFERLCARSKGKKSELKILILRLCALHWLHIACNMCLSGMKSASVKFVYRKKPLVFHFAWIRYILLLLFPSYLFRLYFHYRDKLICYRP